LDDDVNHIKLKAYEISDCLRPRSILGEHWEPGPVDGTWEVRDFQLLGKLARPDVVLTEMIGARESDLKRAIEEGFARVDNANTVNAANPLASTVISNSVFGPLSSCQGIY
jgi:hypothetical protein